MRNKYIGQIEEKMIFAQLPEVKDPIAKGLDTDSELIGCFLSGWNTLASVDALLEYLYIIERKDDSNSEYAELKRFGINSEFEKSRLLFNEQGVVVSSEHEDSEMISLDVFISIVENWKKYLVIGKNENVVFYGGSFFYDIKTTKGIDI